MAAKTKRAVARTSQPARPPELPPLRMEIWKHGALVRVVEVEDPRIVICRSYNELGLTTVARPA
jgi:hypothetical protein